MSLCQIGSNSSTCKFDSASLHCLLHCYLPHRVVIGSRVQRAADDRRQKGQGWAPARLTAACCLELPVLVLERIDPDVRNIPNSGELHITLTFTLCSLRILSLPYVQTLTFTIGTLTLHGFHFPDWTCLSEAYYYNLTDHWNASIHSDSCNLVSSVVRRTSFSLAIPSQIPTWTPYLHLLHISMNLDG